MKTDNVGATEDEAPAMTTYTVETHNSRNGDTVATIVRSASPTDRTIIASRVRPAVAHRACRMLAAGKFTAASEEITGTGGGVLR